MSLATVGSAAGVGIPMLEPRVSGILTMCVRRTNNSFIETHDPQNLKTAMDRTLLDVVPARLHPDLLQSMKSQNWPKSQGCLSASNRDPGPKGYKSSVDVTKLRSGMGPARR